MRTVTDYVGLVGISPRLVTPEDDARMRKRVLDLHDAFGNATPSRHPLRHAPGFTLLLLGVNGLVTEDGAGTPVGVPGRLRMPYVLPRYRGRRVGAAMTFEADLVLGRIPASGYTREGFASRVLVHAMHLRLALDTGRAVPDDVLEDYRIGSGVPVLRSPYTPDEHARRVGDRLLKASAPKTRGGGAAVDRSRKSLPA